MDNSLQEERWVRRGHTRKPNFVVRSIYSIADWLGDFGPLFGSAKRGAGHLSAFAGHSLLLLVTLAITLLLVVTSAIHSLELLNWIGFHGWTVYPILFVVEAIFITGSIQLDMAFKHGKYFPTPPILGFVAGLVFVLASNVTGLAENYGGLIFGIATPFLLIIAKAMLAWQYTFRNKIAAKSIEENKPLPENLITESPQITEIIEEEKPVLEAEIIEENLIDIEPKNDESEPIQKLDFEEENDDLKSLDIEQEKPHENLDVEAPITESISLDIEEEKPAPELIKNLDVEADEKQPKTNQQEKTSSRRKTRKPKGSTGNKKPKRTPASNVDYDAIIEVAKRMIEEHPEKKTPTKYKLSKQAKTTEHHAQKALDKMEEKLEVNLIENLNQNPIQNLDLESDQKPDLERPKLKLAK